MIISGPSTFSVASVTGDVAEPLHCRAVKSSPYTGNFKGVYRNDQRTQRLFRIHKPVTQTLRREIESQNNDGLFVSIGSFVETYEEPGTAFVALRLCAA